MGRPVTVGSGKAIVFSAPASFKAELANYSERAGMNLSQAIRHLVEAGLRHAAEPPEKDTRAT